MQAISDAVNNGFLIDDIGIHDYVLLQLVMQRGLRRMQLIQLTVNDFYKDGACFYINQPKAKQRDQDSTGFRQGFEKFSISSDLYDAVQVLKAYLIGEINNQVGAGFAESLSDIPIFPRLDSVEALSSLRNGVTSSNVVLRSEITNHFRRLMTAIPVYSERTGLIMNFDTRRFRRTLGTDLAREGAGVGVIARALDHTDEQNAGVYIQTSAEVAKRLDAKLGKFLAPLAQAFAGKIVRNEEDARRGKDTTSRIRTIDGSENIGTCGAMSFCNANTPVGCYTCIKFQPWLDAPHEDVLVDLYEDRDEIMRLLDDNTMASVLDRSILAVEDVIRRCEEIKRGSNADG